MDFPGLGQLLLLLAPSSTTADLLYFAALFDLDGDGLVRGGMIISVHTSSPIASTQPLHPKHAHPMGDL